MRLLYGQGHSDQRMSHTRTSDSPTWFYLVPLIVVIGFLLIDIGQIVSKIRSPNAFKHTEVYMEKMLKNTGQGVELRRDLEEGSRVRQFVLGLSFGLACVGLLVPGGRLYALLKRQKLMLLFVLYTLLSISWSVAPSISLRRWLQFAGMLLIAWCAMRATSVPQRLAQILRWAFASAIVLSCLLVLIHFEAATDGNGKWLGIYHHKNILGSVTILAAALWLPCLWSPVSRVERYCAPVLLLLIGLLAWQSDHKGAQVCLLVLVSVWAVLKVPLPGTVKWLSLSSVSALVALYLVNADVSSLHTWFFELLGRNATFTGRLPIWQGVLANFPSHPLFGAGYNAFWTLANREALQPIFIGSKWAPSHAHNGYLDILNELGVVGGGLFLCILCQSLVRAGRTHCRHNSAHMACVLLLAAQLFVNLTESAFCRSTDLVWVTFLFTYVALAKLSVPLPAHGAARCVLPASVVRDTALP